MSIKVQSTTNYSRFKMMEGNRPIEKRVNKLISAITRKNDLSLYPIVVQKNGDGRLYVADGQHRLKAAEALKLPIFYIESSDISLADVIQANGVQKAWSLKDHVYSQAALANPSYVALKAFYEQYRFPLTTCAALLAGKESGNTSESLRAGRFRVKQSVRARTTAEFLVELKPIFKGALDRGFAISILRLLDVPGFDLNRFKTKLSYQTTRLVKCAGWAQYVELIDSIYNHKCRAEDLISLPLEVKKLK